MSGHIREERHGAVIEGEAAKGFENVVEAFADNFSPRHPCVEVGASFAAYRDGEPVVRLWGGFADETHGRRWDEHTICNFYSATKGVGAACVAILADRGLIDYEKPVAAYWPEFAANGKQDITVSVALSHRGGLSGVREPLQPEDLYDWDKMAGLIAAAAPLWEPGDRAGYHAITWGYICGELVRRSTGKTIGAFLRDEVSGPLGADLFIGLKTPPANQIADMVPPKGPPTQSLAEPHEILRLTLGNPVVEAHVSNHQGWREAEIPAANGHGNGDGLARLYGAFANEGRLGGTRLLGQRAIETAVREVFRGEDFNLGAEIGWSAGGFFLNNIWKWYGPDPGAFGHSGWGGSYGFADPKNRVGVGYVPNQMDTNLQGDPRAMRLIAALYASL